jgi:hypothetical protein
MKTILPDNPDGSPPTYPMKRSRAAVPQLYWDVNTTKLTVEVTESGPNEFTLDVKK